MIKVIITGSNGLLGQSLLNLLLQNSAAYQVIGFSRGINKSGRNDFEYVSMDLTNSKLLETHLLNLQPDFIINTAAMTNVDACENNKIACDALNVGLVESLVNVAAQINAHLIHLSTDFIFDGLQGNYKETALPNPLNYYGISKLKSEEILKNAKIDYTILRTILVYGQVFDQRRSNLVLWVKEMLEKKQEISIVNDQFRTPTYVADLALVCKISMDMRSKGVYNIASNTLLSIYEIAQQIASVFELDASYIKAVSTSRLNQRATRPKKTGFDLSKTKKELKFHPKSFIEDLQRFKENAFNEHI